MPAGLITGLDNRASGQTKTAGSMIRRLIFEYRGNQFSNFFTGMKFTAVPEKRAGSIRVASRLKPSA